MSETRVNELEKWQKDITTFLWEYVKKTYYPSVFRNWPILSLLKLGFITQIDMFMVYGNGGNRALIVTEDKNVYDLNYNKDNHLQNDTNIDFPRKIKELCGKNIKTFACNSHFVLALTKEKEVYFWGFNEKRKSDNGSYIPVVASTPTREAGLSEKRIVDIACGSDHSLALTRDGKVYAWGENRYGQIGNGTDTYGDNRPRQVRYELEGKKIVHIACGSMFNMIVTDEGKLYGWGNNNDGQISIDVTTSGESTGSTSHNIQSERYYAYPCEITVVSGKAIDKVACGFEHTLALTKEGKVYAWGKNDKGQVGVNNNLKNSSPVMVNVSEMGKVSEIAAYGNLSVAQVGDSIKTVYVWGDCFDEIFTTPLPTKFSTIDDAFAYTTTRVMYKPLTVPNTENYFKILLKKLDKWGFNDLALDDQSTSDFIIQVEGQFFHVHKTVLKSRSQYFRNKFQHDESNQSLPCWSIHIVLDNFSYIVYKAFLKYLYTGIVDLPPEEVLDLMKLADKYRETNLKKYIINCDLIIEQAITPSNVAFFYGKAIECKAEKVEEICFEFALDYMTKIVLSEEYIKLDNSIKDNFIHRAAKENAFRT